MIDNVKMNYIIRKTLKAHECDGVPLDKALKHYTFVLSANRAEQTALADFFGYSQAIN